MQTAADQDWLFVFDGFDPDDEGRREALCALGNGVYISRAAATWAEADETHYPGTYRAGCYNRLSSEVDGEPVSDESAVNLPSWLPLTFRVDGGPWFALSGVDLLGYRQTLDLRRGLLLRELRFRDRAGRHTALRETRLVSMAQPHLAAVRLELTPEDWAGELELRSGLDGRVVNDNVERYRPYSKRHLEQRGSGAAEPAGIWLSARTTHSRIEVTVAARTAVAGGAGEAREVVREAGQVAELIRVQVAHGATLAVEKVAALVTSRDPAVDECGATARRILGRAPGFAELRAAHEHAWGRLWAQCDLQVAPGELLPPLRLHLFHLMQTISPHSENLDIGLPSRGWQGEEYRGQIFWDELFIFPVLATRFPALARQLLLYRYHRRDEARHLARSHGFAGAMFPWRSASTGREETPAYQLNMLSGGWYRDDTRLQRHINAAIAYNIWQYSMITGDDEFLADYGGELLIEIARFWASAATYNPALGRYEFLGVVGPDEYHTARPGSDEPGLPNNSYTNLMAAWTLARAPELLARLPQERREALALAVQLGEDELSLWDAISRRVRLAFRDDGALSQFEGFEALEPFDVEGFEAEHDGQRVDWTLMAAGDDVNRYRVAKQADVALLAYLLSPDELQALVERQGYRLDRAALRRTLDAALAYTVHESSLSEVIFAGALAPLDGERSWALFREALGADLKPGSSSTATGVHMGSMLGTLGVLHQHYLGVRFGDEGVRLDPAWPQGLAAIQTCMHYRGGQLGLAATGESIEVRAAPTNPHPIPVVLHGETTLVGPGEVVRLIP